MKPKIICVLEGYTYENDQYFLLIVREGDDVGQRFVEGDAGFIEAMREIAASSHGFFARQFLEQYENRKEAQP